MGNDQVPWVGAERDPRVRIAEPVEQACAVAPTRGGGHGSAFRCASAQAFSGGGPACPSPKGPGSAGPGVSVRRPAGLGIKASGQRGEEDFT